MDFATTKGDFGLQENLAEIDDLKRRLNLLSPEDRKDEISIRKQLATRYEVIACYQEAQNQLDILMRINPSEAQRYDSRAKNIALTEITRDLI